ncbi:hypothetical protein C8F04DRAFT_317250 [Mycena alexandri]|uniref:Uncharacterized protein n=1 Tax=Mycena alexandri TaxID=1745969 RepID=A0AAD6T4J4_9AGAR|nr:hypothetical protein C8F04DRAFT_317250 [Mycena alexandri]
MSDVIHIEFEHKEGNEMIMSKKVILFTTYKDAIAACRKKWPGDLHSDNHFALSRFSSSNNDWWEVRRHSKTCAPTMSLGAPITRRTTLVKEIIRRLDANSFLQLRGNPASGKTTLLDLVHLRLRSQGVYVQRYDRPWPTDVGERKDLHNELSQAYDEANQDRPIFILIDEGQATYTDLILWNRFLKAWSGHNKQYFACLIACSWGSTTGLYAPIELDASLRLELRPTAEDSFSLLFNVEEFHELVTSAVNNNMIPELDQDLRKHLFEQTSGYAAVVRCIIYYLQSKKDLVRRQATYGLAEFLQEHPPHKYLPFIQNNIQCRRFLPRESLTRDPRVNRVFSRLFLHGPFNYNEDDPAPGGLDRQDLDFVHGTGLIYIEHVPYPNPLVSSRRLSITFPLQTALIQLSLEPAPWGPLVDIPSLFFLILQVIQRFNPDHLKTSTRVGATASDPPLEATYQREFYKCLYELRPRAILCCEYGTPAGSKSGGRIDFLIHRQEFNNEPRSWGIELLRDGDRLQDHADRFDPVSGAYRAMTSDGMSEFYILDFRTDIPIEPHAQIPDLLHIVWGNDLESFTVYDNNLRKFTAEPMRLLRLH